MFHQKLEYQMSMSLFNKETLLSKINSWDNLVVKFLILALILDTKLGA